MNPEATAGIDFCLADVRGVVGCDRGGSVHGPRSGQIFRGGVVIRGLCDRFHQDVLFQVSRRKDLVPDFHVVGQIRSVGVRNHGGISTVIDRDIDVGVDVCDLEDNPGGFSRFDPVVDRDARGVTGRNGCASRRKRPGT